MQKNIKPSNPNELPQTLELAHEEIKRLRQACTEAYIIMGTVFIIEGEDGVVWDDEDATRVLDNIFAAANGDPIPHSDLLPWPKTNSNLS